MLDPSRVIVVEEAPATVKADRSILFDKCATMLRATLRLEFAAPISGFPCKLAPAA